MSLIFKNRSGVLVPILPVTKCGHIIEADGATYLNEEQVAERLGVDIEAVFAAYETMLRDHDAFAESGAWFTVLGWLRKLKSPNVRLAA